MRGCYKGVQRKEPVRIGLEKSILSFGIKSRGGMSFLARTFQ